MALATIAAICEICLVTLKQLKLVSTRENGLNLQLSMLDIRLSITLLLVSHAAIAACVIAVNLHGYGACPARFITS